MTKDLRVLFLAPPDARPGKLSRYSFLDEEIRALAARGVHAYVITRTAGATKDDGYLHVRVLPGDSLDERRRTLAFLGRHLRAISPANLLDARQLYRSARVERFAARIIARHDISLIHSYFGWPRGFGGQLAAAATGRPLIAGIRGSDVNVIADLRYGARLDPFFDRNVRRLLQRADRTVFVSDFLRKQGVALGAPPQRAGVVMKGVRLDQFSPPTDPSGAREVAGAGPEPMILAVAGLVRIKGLHHVIDALARVRAAGRQFSFIVCGEGPERDALNAQAHALGLGRCVTLRGKVSRDQIATYFAAADLLVHGSIIEASGNVLLEAMAARLPIVCTDAGGPAEYVQNGTTGFVVPVADPRAMADKIVELLDNPELRATLGNNGRALALKAYGYDRMIDETLNVYHLALGSRERCGAASVRAQSRV